MKPEECSPFAPWDLAPARAAVVCARFAQGADVPPPGDLSCRGYFDGLCRQGRYGDAVTFLAHLLPRREAIWWASLCLWQDVRPTPSPEVDFALAAIVRWVREPFEAHCRAAQQAAETLSASPAGLVARAVSFCGASLTPPGMPVVAPPPYLANLILSGAVRMAAAPAGDERFQQYLHWGVDVAAGKIRWS